MRVTVVGSGDAFGSGGRLQTCFHVVHEQGAFLIDCGATSLIGLARAGLDPGHVSSIFVSHLHGDHFSGLVWWLIHSMYVGRRTVPLTIVGPEGIEARFRIAAEALFPGATSGPRRFEMRFVEMRDRQNVQIEGVRVTPFEVSHPSGAPPYALRFEVDGRVLAFSGDTEWTENLVAAAQGANLFICECSAFEARANFHLNWRTIEANLSRLGAERVLLTHLGPEALANRDQIRHASVIVSDDGLEVEV